MSWFLHPTTTSHRAVSMRRGRCLVAGSPAAPPADHFGRDRRMTMRTTRTASPTSYGASASAPAGATRPRQHASMPPTAARTQRNQAPVDNNGLDPSTNDAPADEDELNGTPGTTTDRSKGKRTAHAPQGAKARTKQRWRKKALASSKATVPTVNRDKQPTVNNSAPTLADWVEAIQRAYAAFATAASNAIERARDVGQALIAAKALVGHGKFQRWLERNFSFSHETACGYMRIADNWDKLPELTPGAPPGLSVQKALKLLAKPRQSREPTKGSRPTPKSLTMTGDSRRNGATHANTTETAAEQDTLLGDSGIEPADDAIDESIWEAEPETVYDEDAGNEEAPSAAPAEPEEESLLSALATACHNIIGWRDALVTEFTAGIDQEQAAEFRDVLASVHAVLDEIEALL